MEILCHNPSLKLLQFPLPLLIRKFQRPLLPEVLDKEMLLGGLGFLDHAQIGPQTQTPQQEHLVVELSRVIMNGERLGVAVTTKGGTPLLQCRNR